MMNNDEEEEEEDDIDDDEDDDYDEDDDEDDDDHYRKFQLKMGLLTFIQIPCHHLLANEIFLNLKYRIGLKHFFNINLGIDIIKKLLFCLYF